ncbi:hypothetical protein U0070_021986, partial [Myodes glareolus]
MVQRSLDMSTLFEEPMDLKHSNTRIPARSSKHCAGDASKNFSKDDTVLGPSSADFSLTNVERVHSSSPIPKEVAVATSTPNILLNSNTDIQVRASSIMPCTAGQLLSSPSKFIKMDNKKPNTLLVLAIHQLLSNETAAIHALEEIPRELFVPLFCASFKGVHKNIVKAMVKIWPFTCLHIGTFTVREPHRELLTAMLECLQFLPVQNSGSRSPKLRILDLREDSGCKIVCPEIDHLETALRVFPTSLDFLHLTFCELSYNDFKFLAECPQANNLKLLNITHNPMCWEDCEPFYNLLHRISGTLQHLAVNQCILTDSIVAGVIPALSRCSQLRVFNLSSNPLSMPMLMRLLEHLTPLMQLKYVIYPIPVHCYGRWPIQDTLDHQKLANVQARLKRMLREAGRSDMI